MADQRPKNFKRAVLNQKITRLVEGRRYLQIHLENGEVIQVLPEDMFDREGNRFSMNNIKIDTKEE